MKGRKKKGYYSIRKGDLLCRKRVRKEVKRDLTFWARNGIVETERRKGCMLEEGRNGASRPKVTDSFSPWKSYRLSKPEKRPRNCRQLGCRGGGGKKKRGVRDRGT